MNTTETYWSVDGVSLQTYAFNIESLGGARAGVPELRGEDIEVPYAAGRTWVPKVPDSRTIPLGMWVLGTLEDGTLPTDKEQRRQWEVNWRKLQRLLWTPRRQFALGKHFWIPTEELTDAGMDLTGLTQASGFTLIYAEAKGQYSDGLEPQMTGQTRGTFTVDIDLADPYFYSAEIDRAFAVGLPQTFFVAGDDRTTHVEVDLEGPLTSARLTNSTNPDLDVYFQYSTTVADGHSATVRSHSHSATHFPGGPSYKSSGYVQHDGDPFWFYLDPGDSTVELTAASGTGAATLRYRPGWL